MWTCPVCNREFKNTNQNHSCGKKHINIDEYIEAQAPELRDMLYKVRDTIKENAPDSTEKMSWQMPTFYQKENLIHFACAKNHLGIYPGEEAVRIFADKLSGLGLKFSKGSIQLPYKNPIPYDLIGEITRHRVDSVEGGLNG